MVRVVYTCVPLLICVLRFKIVMRSICLIRAGQASTENIIHAAIRHGRRVARNIRSVAARSMDEVHPHAFQCVHTFYWRNTPNRTRKCLPAYRLVALISFSQRNGSVILCVCGCVCRSRRLSRHIADDLSAPRPNAIRSESIRPVDGGILVRRRREPCKAHLNPCVPTIRETNGTLMRINMPWNSCCEHVGHNDNNHFQYGALGWSGFEVESVFFSSICTFESPIFACKKHVFGSERSYI